MFEDNFNKAITRAKIISPLIQKGLKSQELILLDSFDNKDLRSLFDREAGFDALIKDESGIRGLALRIQCTPHPYKPFNTFTIRHKTNRGGKTEYEKRSTAIKKNSGHLYPYLTGQFYLNEKDVLLSGAICITKDLYNYTESYLEKIINEKRKNTQDNTDFLIVRFTELPREKIRFFDNQVSGNLFELLSEEPQL